jgi:hypothetical protein
MSNKSRWRPTQYPGYKVSDTGEVMSFKKDKPRLLAQNPDKDGYMCVTLFPDKKYIKAKVHRLVAEAFVKGRTKLKKFACHKDGNNQNNNYTNLKWATPRENVMDMAKHGTNIRWWTPDNCPTGKLTAKQVKKIKEKLRIDTTWGIQSKLARLYNVCPKTINDIKRGKNWKSIS